jgi:hypothetical protein
MSSGNIHVASASLIYVFTGASPSAATWHQEVAEDRGSEDIVLVTNIHVFIWGQLSGCKRCSKILAGLGESGNLLTSAPLGFFRHVNDFLHGTFLSSQNSCTLACQAEQ